MPAMLKKFQQDVREGINARLDNVRELYAQIAASNPQRIDQARRNDGVVVLQAPTGAGKTLIAVEAMRAASGAERIGWDLVYQSRSGPASQPWLEPDVNDVIERLKTDDQADAVVVVPIGFVTDHVEVVWDLDTEAKETAAEQGLAFRRAATSGPYCATSAAHCLRRSSGDKGWWTCMTWFQTPSAPRGLPPPSHCSTNFFSAASSASTCLRWS